MKAVDLDIALTHKELRSVPKKVNDLNIGIPNPLLKRQKMFGPDEGWGT
jgi:hypothetical protein